MLRDDEKEKRVLVSVSEFPWVGGLLRELRLNKIYSYSGVKHAKGTHASKTQIAKKIGCHSQQILRMERFPLSGKDVQKPGLDIFKKICLLFQVDPIEFMGLRWLGERNAEKYCKNVLDKSAKEVKNSFCSYCGSYTGGTSDIIRKWYNDK